MGQLALWSTSVGNVRVATAHRHLGAVHRWRQVSWRWRKRQDSDECTWIELPPTLPSRFKSVHVSTHCCAQSVALFRWLMKSTVTETTRHSEYQIHDPPCAQYQNQRENQKIGSSTESSGSIHCETCAMHMRSIVGSKQPSQNKTDARSWRASAEAQSASEAFGLQCPETVSGQWMAANNSVSSGGWLAMNPHVPWLCNSDNLPRSVTANNTVCSVRMFGRSFFLRSLSFLQPLAQLTSKMREHCNARTVHAGSLPSGKRQHPQGNKVGGAEKGNQQRYKMEPAPTWSNPHRAPTRETSRSINLKIMHLSQIPRIKKRSVFMK